MTVHLTIEERFAFKLILVTLLLLGNLKK